MKKILFVICFVLGVASVGAQVNLVPNPSFEIHDSCPDDIGEINYLANWKIYKQTPDFFSTCSTISYASVPNNIEGYQEPNSGNSYIGLWCYITNSFYREIVGVQLTSPLNVGQIYYTKFSANLALEYSNLNANSSINKLGLKFSNTDYSSSQNPPINNSANLISNGYITDTANWTTVFGSFIADSAYSYLMIGIFYDDIHTHQIRYGGTSDSNSYYFIDDICVSTDSAYAYNYSVTGIQNNTIQNIIKIYPNPNNGTMTIEYHLTENQSGIFSIYDVTGKLMRVFNFNNATTKCTINESELAAGVYMYDVLINGIKIKTDKLIIIK